MRDGSREIEGRNFEEGREKTRFADSGKRVSKSNFLKISSLSAFFSTSIYRESLIVPLEMTVFFVRGCIYLGLSIASYPIWFSNFFSNALRIQQNAPKFLHVKFDIFFEPGMTTQSPFKVLQGICSYSAYSSVIRPSNDGGLYHLSRWACHLLQITVHFLNASAWDETNVLRIKKLHHFA